MLCHALTVLAFELMLVSDQAAPAPNAGTPLAPVPFTAVKFDDDFWAPRIKLTVEKTIPHCFKMCEETGRIRNWEKAAKREGEFEGYFFNDSDVYKVMEGAAYALHHFPDAKYGETRLDAYLDELIAKIAAMQWPDGYVNSYFTLKKDEKRWTDIEHKHELYCAGHLIEAAVAHYTITGKRNFLDIALKLADHICDTFGPGRNMNPCGHPEIELALLRLAELESAQLVGRSSTSLRAAETVERSSPPPPAAETEERSSTSLGPVNAARAAKYRALAAFFVDQHGNKTGRERLWGEYAQDEKPLVEQREIKGHAVRAMYFYSAATDLARLARSDAGTGIRSGSRPAGIPSGDPQVTASSQPAGRDSRDSGARKDSRTSGEPGAKKDSRTSGDSRTGSGIGADAYITALDSLWTDLTTRKMYITGGIGSSAHNEGFTAAYDLPNETAYAESCAAIGMVFWNYRLNLLHADAKYYDVLERALYNGVLSGISLDGEKFFYSNPLASRGQHERKPWYPCACCPPNFCRLLTSVGNYMYAVGKSEDGTPAIYVNMYAQSTATIRLTDDLTVTIRQRSRYPWEESLAFVIEPSQPASFELCVRQPGWVDAAAKPQLRLGDANDVSGATKPADVECGTDGYWRIRRAWKAADLLECELRMPVRAVAGDPRVKADVGRRALQRGPIVYCLEQSRNEPPVRRLFIPPESAAVNIGALPPESHRTGHITQGVLPLMGNARISLAPDSPAHGADDAPQLRSATVTAWPYFAWSNGAPGDMTVWIPESAEYVDPEPVRWVKPSASHCWPRDTLAALHDRSEPANSGDQSIPRFTWWPKKGGEKGDGEQWAQYDFDKPRRVSAVEVYWFSDSPRGGCAAPAEWKLLYRAAGAAADEWREVKSVDERGVKLDEFNRVSFDPVEAAGLRMVVKLADGKSAGILEWRVE